MNNGVVGVLQRLLRDSKTSAIEGNRYSLHQESQTDSLTLTAKDGRGTILKQSQGYIVQSTLLPQDLKVIESLDHKLTQQAAERIQSTYPNNQKSRVFDIGA